MASSAKQKPVDARRIKMHFKRAFEFKNNWIKEAHEDFRFALGKQWEDKDIEELKAKGVLPITINKIKPNIKLLTGIESQNRSDILCYPEGKESGVMAEISTALVKNVFKTSGLNYKRSEQFRYGIICGECYLEPYVDYTYDLINGDMKFKKCAFNTIFPEPGFEEYDLSDANYMIKLTMGLSREEVLSLFPDSGDYLDEIGANGEIQDYGMPSLKDELGISIQRRQYNDSNIGASVTPSVLDTLEEPRYDLVEYYFKKWVKKYYVIRFMRGPDGNVIQAEMKEAESMQEADTFVAAANLNAEAGKENAKIITRSVPEIWRASLIGNSEDLIEEESRAPSYPKWPSYPFIPYFAERYTLPLKETETHLLVQGIVRDMKMPNREYNKRRTQELRILNTSASSGWIVEDLSIIDEAKWEKYGSSPGVILKTKKGVPPTAPQKILPTPVSQGHAQLAAEGSQDMKESSGINAEMLAMQTGEAKSGRAIALRQKQGLVMVQSLFDNLSQTTRLLGKFILSHLGDVFDVAEAIHVLGDAFVKDNFSEPKLMDQVNPQTGQPEKAPQLGPDGKLVMEVNKERVVQTFNQVLSDATLGKFEVAVGESISNETLKYANYMVLMDMAEKGIPIPPDVLVDESMLSNASKEKIKSYIEQQQQAAQAAAKQAPPAAA